MSFTDTFSNGTGSSQNLTARTGWTLVAGAAGDAFVGAGNNSLTTSPTGEYLATCTDQGSADHSTTVVLLDTCASWWVIRATDESNFIGARHNGTAWQVFKRVAAAFTQLGSDYTVALTPGDTAELKGNGDQITFKVNGTPRCLGSGVTETFNQTATKQGVQVRNSGATAWLDSFTAAPNVAAPVITGPSGASVTAPSTANFSATVSGTYTGLRWQRQAAGAGAWADVTGGTGSTTTSYTTGATAVSGGSFNSTDRFRLAVDWSGGTVLSTDVALTVAAGGTAPSITTQPTAPTVTVGSTASMSVTATGSGTLTYQWQRQPAAGGGYTNISGANSASYTTPATTISGGSANNGDTYRCVVTGDTSPPATSNAVALTVQQPLATTFTFTLNGGNSLSSLKYAVFDQVTPDLWAAPVKKGSNASSNGSGVVTLDVTGVTARRLGDLGSAVLTNSDGTATGGSQAATRKAAYYVGVFS